ncbi:MAG: hypothetical protein WDW38_002181 [Sanguina aurantia]
MAVVNAGRYGFYRVNYEPQTWEAIAEEASSPDYVSAIDLAGMLDDSFHLSFSPTHLDATVFMNMTAALGTRQMPEYDPWVVAIGGLRRARVLLANLGQSSPQWLGCAAMLDGYIAGPEFTAPPPLPIRLLRGGFVDASSESPRGFIDAAFIPGQDGYGLTFDVTPGQPAGARLLRPLVLLMAGEAGNLGVQRTAYTMWGSARKSRMALHPDVEEAVTALAVLGDASEFTLVLDSVKTQYKTATSPEKRAMYLEALSYAQYTDDIFSVLQYALSSEVPVEEMPTLIAAVGRRGGNSFAAAWAFLSQNMGAIMARYGSNGGAAYSVGRMLDQLAQLLVEDGAEMAAMRKVLSGSYNGEALDSFTLLRSANESVITNGVWLTNGATQITPRPASRIATDRPDRQRPEDNPDLDDLVLDDAYYEEMGISREDVMEQLAWDPADVDPESYDIGDRPGSSHRPGSRQLLQGDDADDVEVQQPMGNSSSWADDRFGGEWVA